VLLLLVGCRTVNTPIGGSPVHYEADELESLFLSNQDAFQELAQIILDNELCEGSRFRFNYAIDYPKQFFAPEEWEKIQQFFNTFNPVEVTRYQYTAIEIHFEMSKNMEQNSLYYIAPTALFDHPWHYVSGYNDDRKVTEIADNWYLVEWDRSFQNGDD